MMEREIFFPLQNNEVCKLQEQEIAGIRGLTWAYGGGLVLEWWSFLPWECVMLDRKRGSGESQSLLPTQGKWSSTTLEIDPNSSNTTKNWVDDSRAHKKYARGASRARTQEQQPSPTSTTLLNAGSCWPDPGHLKPIVKNQCSSTYEISGPWKMKETKLLNLNTSFFWNE